MYNMGIKIDHNSDGVGCFDPMQVIYRLSVEFPKLKNRTKDHLLDTCKILINLGSDESGALKTAAKDLYERGPALLFEIPVEDNIIIKGVSERYSMRVHSDKPFTNDFKKRFKSVVNGIFMQEIEFYEEHG